MSPVVKSAQVVFDRNSVLFSVLRGVVRTGAAVVGASSFSIGAGKKAVEKCVKVYLDRMGFVSREEFESLRESVLKNHATKQTAEKDSQ